MKNLNLLGPLTVMLPLLIFIIVFLVIPYFFGIPGTVIVYGSVILSVVSLVLYMLYSTGKTDKTSSLVTTIVGVFAIIPIVLHLMIIGGLVNNTAVIVTENEVIDPPTWFHKGEFVDIGNTQDSSYIDITYNDIRLYGGFALEYNKTKANQSYLTGENKPPVDEYVTDIFTQIEEGECVDPHLVLKYETDWGWLSFQGKWDQYLHLDRGGSISVEEII